MGRRLDPWDPQLPATASGEEGVEARVLRRVRRPWALGFLEAQRGDHQKTRFFFLFRFVCCFFGDLFLVFVFFLSSIYVLIYFSLRWGRIMENIWYGDDSKFTSIIALLSTK